MLIKLENMCINEFCCLVDCTIEEFNNRIDEMKKLFPKQYTDEEYIRLAKYSFIRI